MQGGQIMTISTPGEVTRSYPWSLLSVKSGDIYHLLADLRVYPGVHSVYAFGQVAHLAFRGKDIDQQCLHDHLVKLKHYPVEITTIEAGIEDCFMDLMGCDSKDEGRRTKDEG
jgi:hypothetical protein